METKEVWKIESTLEVGAILSNLDIDPSPTFCAYGIEIYCDKNQQIIVQVNCRGDKREVTIFRGNGSAND